MVDKASWHQGALIKQVLADHPHLELYPLPSSSPKLHATHHRLFETLAKRKQAWRSSLCYYQTLKHRVLTLIASRRKRTKLSVA